MSWNYRVIYHPAPEGNERGEDWLGIHEVYYATDTDDHPLSYSTEHVGVMSTDGVGGLGWVLDRMREALNKPILTTADFPSAQ